MPQERKSHARTTGPREAIAATTVVVVGAGGNIGSALCRHIGRWSGIDRVLLCDPDTYDRSNLTGQDIVRADVGKPKVEVQARRLRRINPALAVTPIADVVERVPLGWLRSSVILTCLDSRAARRSVNRLSWRLSLPWIDAGVAARDALLVRMTAYRPGIDSPCMECSFDEDDYRSLGDIHSCVDFATAADSTTAESPTAAPSTLGALAASLQGLEAQKLLGLVPGRSLVGEEVIIDAAHHRHYLTSLTRNPACRWDHQSWSITKLGLDPAELSLRAIFDLVDGADPRTTLSLEGHRFVLRLSCTNPACDQRRELLHLAARLTAPARLCEKCGHDLTASTFDLVDRLVRADLSPEHLERSAQDIGLVAGDVISIGRASETTHYEI
jgi:molybdopterin/thiamine biosynthesis adenylyltransferase